MFGKIREKQKMSLLQKSINKLTKILENMNLHDWIYVLGSKKEIIRRNFLAGIARGIGGRNRFYNNNCNYNIFFAKNCEIEYTCDWKIYK